LAVSLCVMQALRPALYQLIGQRRHLLTFSLSRRFTRVQRD
jgi:hypothetical protein